MRIHTRSNVSYLIPIINEPINYGIRTKKLMGKKLKEYVTTTLTSSKIFYVFGGEICKKMFEELKIMKFCIRCSAELNSTNYNNNIALVCNDCCSPRPTNEPQTQQQQPTLQLQNVPASRGSCYFVRTILSFNRDYTKLRGFHEISE
uniref:Uncharacterized protein n=1 Tax=Meloidogyne hapla TaxID=6305 RepID=A0A1I8BH39_MELHA